METRIDTFFAVARGRQTDVELGEGDVVLGVSATADAVCTNVTWNQLPARPGRPGALRVKLHGGPDCVARLTVVVARL